MTPVLRQSVREQGFVQNPYPVYAAAREMGPLVWWEELGRLAATTHEAVNFFLRDRRFGRSMPEEMQAPLPAHLANFGRIEEFSLLELDGAHHRAIRSQLLRSFTSRRISALAPEIEEFAQTKAAGLEPGMDLLRDFITPLPVTTIARLLGVSDNDGDALLRWSHAMCRMYTNDPPMADQYAADRACLEFHEYLTDVITSKRRLAGDDLASALISDGRMSEAEMISTLVLLLNAGHEATVHALGNAIKLLAGQPWLAEAGAVANTVEECLRFDPPLHLFDRVAQEDCEAFGVPFKRGDKIACLLGSANRDEAVFSDAHRFDPDRDAKAQVAFGAGVHFCLGTPLARLEMTAALISLFGRWPSLQVEPGPYADSWHFHGLESLTISRMQVAPRLGAGGFAGTATPNRQR